MRRFLGVLLASVMITAVVAPVPASADPDELIPCRLLLVKAPPSGPIAAGVTKFVCRGTVTLPSAGAAPTGTGNFISVDVNVVPPGTSLGLGVGPCQGLGSPAGSSGYKCRDPLGDLVLIKPNLVKAVVKYDLTNSLHGTLHPYASAVDVAIKVVSSGTSDSKQYCARFGGRPARLNSATIYKRTSAPAPTACSPSGAFLDEAGLL